MTEAVNRVSADPGRHEWQRAVPGWHLTFGVMAAVTASLIAADDSLSGPRRWGGLAVLAALALWYLGVGMRALHRGPGRLGATYLALAIPLTVGLFALSPIGSVMLFMLYPHIWALLVKRQTLAVTAITTAGTAAAMLTMTDASAGGMWGVAAWSGAALAFAFALGLWITRIIEQSRQRAELVSELSAARAQLAEVSRRAGVAAERERLARDIHDTLAQGFAGVVLLVEAAASDVGRDDEAARRRLERAGEIARENLTEARLLVEALTPAALSEASLPDALRRMLDRLGGELDVECVFEVTGNPRRLSTDQEVTLLRVVQEALTNVRKHSGASRVDVRLDYSGARVELRVADDGRGFDPLAPHNGYGLSGMRDRVAAAGGTLSVDAAPSAGTAIRAEWELWRFE
ncbi:MAG: sensor histidine kinase [Stackebrandtia sp.]